MPLGLIGPDERALVVTLRATRAYEILRDYEENEGELIDRVNRLTRTIHLKNGGQLRVVPTNGDDYTLAGLQAHHIFDEYPLSPEVRSMIKASAA